jgi:hypothetical protein
VAVNKRCGFVVLHESFIVTCKPGKFDRAVSLARIVSDVGSTAEKRGETLQLKLHKSDATFENV